MTPASAEPPSRRRVLLVEDDATLRALLARALRGAGFEVEETSTGDQAVEAFERECPEILLSDLVLPGVNGQELASRCRRRCADTTIVFMSGYSEDELHRLDIKQVVFIPKPIMPKELVALLERLLEARPSG